MNAPIKLIAAAAACAALTACSTPRYLIAESLTGGRTSKTVMMPTAATDKDTTLYNYVIRMCDIDAQGVESNCKDSVVLENVVANPVN